MADQMAVQWAATKVLPLAVCWVDNLAGSRVEAMADSWGARLAARRAVAWAAPKVAHLEKRLAA